MPEHFIVYGETVMGLSVLDIDIGYIYLYWIPFSIWFSIVEGFQTLLKECSVIIIVYIKAYHANVCE